MVDLNRRGFIGALGLAAMVGGLGTPAAQAAPATAAAGGLALCLMPSGGDDTVALQAAIDEAVKKKMRLELGQGVFHISGTLKIDTCIDFSLTGMGAADPGDKSDGFVEKGRVLGTCLRWKGPAGGTMILLQSAMRPMLTGLYLDAAQTAAVCIQLHTVLGWPTSGVRLRDIAVAHATEVGIQFETPNLPHGDNTDLSDFETVLLQKCRVGIRVCNDQSVGHYWRRINNSFSQVAIEFLQGGDVIIERGWQDGPGPADATFFKTHGGGENAAQIQISGIHLEHGRLFDSRLAGIVVGIRGIQDSRSDTHAPPLCIFGKWAGAVTIMASQLKGPIIATPETSVTLIGCTYVTASVPHPVRKLVQGTKKVHVL